MIVSNKKARHIYEKIGFRESRLLNCYKGTIALKEPAIQYPITHLSDYDWKTMQGFRSWTPTWQNAAGTIARSAPGTFVAKGVYLHEKLAGYLIYQPASKKIIQFAVDPVHRGKGIAKALLHHIVSNHSAELILINADSSHPATKRFLHAAGFDPFIDQYEMELRLDGNVNEAYKK